MSIRRFLLFNVSPFFRETPINQLLRDKVCDALQEARCAIVDEVYRLCDEINKEEEEKLRTVETKASIFFGLVGASTLFAGDILLKSSSEQKVPLLVMVAVVFFVSSVALLAAIWPRRFLRLNGEDIFRGEVLSCKDCPGLDLPWQEGSNNHSEPGEVAPSNERHSELHARVYKRFIVEQYWANIEYNAERGEMKAICLRLGALLFVVELLIVTLSALWINGLESIVE